MLHRRSTMQQHKISLQRFRNICGDKITCARVIVYPTQCRQILNGIISQLLTNGDCGADQHCEEFYLMCKLEFFVQKVSIVFILQPLLIFGEQVEV